MKQISEMTNRQLVKRHEVLSERFSKLVDWFCDNGMGDLKTSDIRRIENPCKEVIRYLNLLDEMSEIQDEARRRYGPEFKTIRQLLNQ